MNSTQPSGIAGTSPAPEEEWTIGNKIPQTPRKRFDPLKVLPEEIWIRIIAESASEMHFRTRIVISQDTLLDFMQVSRSWSVQISSSAVLWVDIILRDEYDAAAKATLALHYSRQALLALYMHYPTGWWDTLQEQIVANRTRIAKLVIYRDLGPSFDLPILRQLSPLPSLATFNCGWIYKAQQNTLNYLSDSPLAWTDLLLDRDTLRKKTIRGLRGIHLDCELEDVFDLLEGSKHLREVLMNPGAENPTSKVKTLSLQGPPLPWTSLKYNSSRDSFLEGIFARLLNLVDLQIRVSPRIFRYLMPRISQLESLSILEMNLSGKWDKFERLVIPQASTSVRKVSIIIISDIYPVMDSVADALSRCLPNIRFLELDINDLPTIHLLASSTTFQSLQSLRFNSCMSEEDTGINSDSVLDQFATSVERVSYMFCGELLKELIPLQSWHIKYLDIYCFALSEMDLYSQRWTAIRTINLGANITVNWKGPTYHYLHTIIFGTLVAGSVGRGGKNATKLCRDIALHPQYFPVLSKLEFEECPELDVLFILLEGRNVATRPGVVPIATLVISTRCPPLLVERLRDMVKGVVHGFSNYYDLSIAGNYDIITDPLITGCFACHRALRFCTEPLNPRGAYFPTIVMEYPESVTEILESWDVRAEKWYPVEETQRSRKCQRRFPLVSITR